jgi:hypothetical protein
MVIYNGAVLVAWGEIEKKVPGQNEFNGGNVYAKLFVTFPLSIMFVFLVYRGKTKSEC